MSKSLTKSLVKWEKSDGKKMLKQELWDVNSSFHSMNIKDIHSSDARFSVYPLKNFTTNYKNLKKNVDGLRAQVDFDNHAVSQHKKSYPCSSHTKQGYPHWNDHPAKQHLEDDVYNGIADTNASKPIEDDPQVVPRLSTRHFMRKSACREGEAEGANLLGCQEKQNCDESAFKGSSGDEKE